MAKDAAGIVKPALIGGVVFGFLGGAPFVELINCACCALVIGSGLLAALLHSRDARLRGMAYTAGSGAKVGFAAGVVYAFVETVTSTVSGLLFQETAMKWVLELLREVPSIPPEVLEQLSRQTSRGLTAGVLLELMTALGFGIIFGTLGGLIGGAAFKSGSPKQSA